MNNHKTPEMKQKMWNVGLYKDEYMIFFFPPDEAVLVQPGLMVL